MQNNQIEDQLRDRLRQLPTPIDVDALWEEVEPRLPKQSRRVLPSWFWFVAGLTVYGFLLQLSDVRHTSSQPLATISQESLITEIEAPAPAIKATTSTLPPPAITTPENTLIDLSPKSVPKSTSTDPFQPAITKLSSSVTEQEKPFIYAKTNTFIPEVNTTSLSMAIAPSADSENIAQAETVPIGTAAKVGKETIVPTQEETTARADDTAEQKLQGMEMVASREAIEQEAKPRTAPENSEEAEKLLLTAGATVLSAPLDQQGLGDQQLAVNNVAKETKETKELPLTPSTQETTYVQIKPNEKEEEVKAGHIRSKKSAYWTVEPGVALSLARNSRSGVEGPGSEDALEGISLQGLVGYHSASGLSVRTGLAMSRISSVLEAEVDRPGTRTEEVVTTLIENTNGVINEQTDLVEVAFIETTTSKFYNSVSSVDIPVLIGYRFSGNKWGLLVEAGPTFNISSGGEAHRYNGTRFAAVDGNYFRKRLKGQGYLINLGGTYRLMGNTSIALNLRYQSFGNDGFEEPELSDSSTNYRLLGVQVGYRVRF